MYIYIYTERERERERGGAGARPGPRKTTEEDRRLRKGGSEKGNPERKNNFERLEYHFKAMIWSDPLFRIPLWGTVRRGGNRVQLRILNKADPANPKSLFQQEMCQILLGHVRRQQKRGNQGQLRTPNKTDPANSQTPYF